MNANGMQVNRKARTTAITAHATSLAHKSHRMGGSRRVASTTPSSTTERVITTLGGNVVVVASTATDSGQERNCRVGYGQRTALKALRCFGYTITTGRTGRLAVETARKAGTVPVTSTR